MTLITGLGYRVKQWGGKWDGTMDVVNSCNCHGAVVQGCASYYVSRVLTSLQRPYEQVQCSFFSNIMVRCSELEVTGH